jgi:hypothetical protein
VKTDRLTKIGLDRLVCLAWLEKAASLALAQNSANETRATLRDDLAGAFRSSRPDVHGSLTKTITILAKVWLTVPPELESLRVNGLELLTRTPQHQHKVIHWGMVTAAYPFWSGVATQVGRLLKLQGSAAAAHIQRRVREQYGERETVSRRTRYVLRSHLDWGVLKETGHKGIYTASPPLAIEDPQLIAWLMEASLHARASRSAPLKDLLESPSLFPFSLKATHPDSLLSASANLELFRHSLDECLIMLRQQPSRQAESVERSARRKPSARRRRSDRRQGHQPLRRRGHEGLCGRAGRLLEHAAQSTAEVRASAPGDEMRPEWESSQIPTSMSMLPATAPATARGSD